MNHFILHRTPVLVFQFKCIHAYRSRLKMEIYSNPSWDTCEPRVHAETHTQSLLLTCLGSVVGIYIFLPKVHSVFKIILKWSPAVQVSQQMNNNKYMEFKMHAKKKQFYAMPLWYITVVASVMSLLIDIGGEGTGVTSCGPHCCCAVWWQRAQRSASSAHFCSWVEWSAD